MIHTAEKVINMNMLKILTYFNWKKCIQIYTRNNQKIKKFCPNSGSGSKSGTGTGFILPKMRLICFSVSSGLILTPGLFFSADLCLTRVVFVLVISSVSLLALRWLFMYMLYFLCCFVLIMVLLWLIIYLSRLFRWLLVLSKKFLESIEIYFLFFAVSCGHVV